MLENINLPDVPAKWPGLYRWQLRYKYASPHIILQKWMEPRLFRRGHWEDIADELVFLTIYGEKDFITRAKKIVKRIDAELNEDTINGNTVMAKRS